MALYSTEIDAIRYHLGYPLTRIGAEPYIGFSAVFDKAIVPYLTDTATTSTTVVVASTTTVPVSSLIVLTDPTGFVAGASVILDVGASQETATVQTSGSGQILCQTLLAHGPSLWIVALNGAEQIVRGILARLTSIETEMRYTAPAAGGIKSVDEIEFFGAQGNRGRGQRSKIDDLVYQRDIARNDLADAIGVPNIRNAKRGGGRMELY